MSPIILAFLYGISQLVTFGRQRSVIIPFCVITITFPELIPYIPDDFQQLVYIMYVLMVMGLVFFIFRGSNVR